MFSWNAVTIYILLTSFTEKCRHEYPVYWTISIVQITAYFIAILTTLAGFRYTFSKDMYTALPPGTPLEQNKYSHYFRP